HTFFPAIVVIGLGMAITVAPLTTTAMGAVSADHAGVASGVNNAVSRIAGLVAIAVFGVVVARVFDAGMTAEMQHVALPVEARAAVDRERPKMAGVDVNAIASLPASRRDDVRNALDVSFGNAFRVSMLGAALLAVFAAASGAAIPKSSATG